jgi:hypothetical protein
MSTRLSSTTFTPAIGEGEDAVCLTDLFELQCAFECRESSVETAGTQGGEWAGRTTHCDKDDAVIAPAFERDVVLGEDARTGADLQRLGGGEEPKVIERRATRNAMLLPSFPRKRESRGTHRALPLDPRFRG